MGKKHKYNIFEDAMRTESLMGHYEFERTISGIKKMLQDSKWKTYAIMYEDDIKSLQNNRMIKFDKTMATIASTVASFAHPVFNLLGLHSLAIKPLHYTHMLRQLTPESARNDAEIIENWLRAVIWFGPGIIEPPKKIMELIGGLGGKDVPVYIEEIKNQRALYFIVKLDKGISNIIGDLTNKVIALNRITDPNILSEIAKDKSLRIERRIQAVKKIDLSKLVDYYSSRDILPNNLQRSINIPLSEFNVEKTLKRIAKNKQESPELRIAAINKIVDIGSLNQIASDRSENVQVRVAIIGKMTDQKALAKIVSGSDVIRHMWGNDPQVAEAVIARMNSQKKLEKIAKNINNQDKVRIAAKEKLDRIKDDHSLKDSQDHTDAGGNQKEAAAQEKDVVVDMDGDGKPDRTLTRKKADQDYQFGKLIPAGKDAGNIKDRKRDNDYSFKNEGQGERTGPYKKQGYEFFSTRENNTGGNNNPQKEAPEVKNAEKDSYAVDTDGDGTPDASFKDQDKLFRGSLYKNSQDHTDAGGIKDKRNDGGYSFKNEGQGERAGPYKKQGYEFFSTRENNPQDHKDAAGQQKEAAAGDKNQKKEAAQESKKVSTTTLK